MRTFSETILTKPGWAETGIKTEPTTNELSKGGVNREAWPSAKMNWFWRRLEDLAFAGIRGAVGSFVSEPRQMAAELLSIKWHPDLQVWIGVPDATSGNLWWSYDGDSWKQGASFTITNEPMIGGLEIVRAGASVWSVVFGFIDGSGDLIAAGTTDPLNSAASMAVADPTATGSPTAEGWLRTRKSSTATGYSMLVASVKDATQPIVVVDTSTGVTSWAPASGFGSVSFNSRITHYTSSVWFGIGYGGSGYTLAKFYDDTANLANASTVYSFATVYPNLDLTAIEINPNTGRLVVMGTDSDTEDLLRILYSDDFGVTWADATVPAVDFGAPASPSTTIEKILYLGGSCWVAFCRSSTGYVRADNVFFSVDDGAVWEEAVKSAGLGTDHSLLRDADYNGKLWLSTRYTGTTDVQLRGAILP